MKNGCLFQLFMANYDGKIIVVCIGVAIHSPPQHTQNQPGCLSLLRSFYFAHAGEFLLLAAQKSSNSFYQASLKSCLIRLSAMPFIICRITGSFRREIVVWQIIHAGRPPYRNENNKLSP